MVLSAPVAGDQNGVRGDPFDRRQVGHLHTGDAVAEAELGGSSRTWQARPSLVLQNRLRGARQLAADQSWR